MGSDCDYINDHLGGHDESGIPNFVNTRGFRDNDLELKEELQFNTFAEAKEWSLKNEGKPFTRNPNGNGFIPKPRRR